MTQEKLTHWKKLTNPNYIGAYDFDPSEKERVLTIKSVSREVVAGPDGKKEECTILHFTSGKPMIMNATNQKMIAKLADSPYIEQWAGLSIKVFVAKVKAFGETVDALRIKSEKVAAKALPALEIGTENFTKCKAAIASGQFTLDQVKGKYSITAEVEAALLAK